MPARSPFPSPSLAAPTQTLNLTFLYVTVSTLNPTVGMVVTDWLSLSLYRIAAGDQSRLPPQSPCWGYVDETMAVLVINTRAGTYSFSPLHPNPASRSASPCSRTTSLRAKHQPLFPPVWDQHSRTHTESLAQLPSHLVSRSTARIRGVKRKDRQRLRV
jgi:hypothetical protein